MMKMLKDNIKRFLGNTTRVILGGLLTIAAIAAFAYFPYNFLLLIVALGIIGAVFDILISQSKRIAELEERIHGLEYKVRRLEDTR